MILSTSDFPFSDFHELPPLFPAPTTPIISLGQEQSHLRVHSDMRAQHKGMWG